MSMYPLVHTWGLGIDRVVRTKNEYGCVNGPFETGQCLQHLISPQTRAATQAAISDRVSETPDTDALITNLRYNSGGHPDAVASVLSYLLDGAPVHLNGFIDRNGTVKNSYSTTTEAELPKNAVRFGGSKPLLAAFLLRK